MLFTYFVPNFHISSCSFFYPYLNIGKTCGWLIPPKRSKVYLPCYTTFGSSCILGCIEGFIAFGNNLATCRVTDTREVAWEIGNFTCEGWCFLNLAKNRRILATSNHSKLLSTTCCKVFNEVAHLTLLFKLGTKRKLN